MPPSTSSDGDLNLSAKPDQPAPDPFGGSPGGGSGGYDGHGGGVAEVDPVATAALICGILSFPFICCCGCVVFILGPVAIGLGLWSVMRIKADPEHLTGAGMAWAGVGLGAGALVLYIVLMAIYLSMNILSAALQ